MDVAAVSLVIEGVETPEITTDDSNSSTAAACIDVIAPTTNSPVSGKDLKNSTEELLPSHTNSGDKIIFERSMVESEIEQSSRTEAAGMIDTCENENILGNMNTDKQEADLSILASETAKILVINDDASSPASEQNSVGKKMPASVEDSTGHFISSESSRTKVESDANSIPADAIGVESSSLAGKEVDKASDERMRGTGREAEKVETVDDKEDDDENHFTETNFATQIDGASEDDIIEIDTEKKEETEEFQDEEADDYCDEEQEEEPDDDEIEGNPAYIPKSGRYYMHDSRNIDDERIHEPSSHSRADGKWKHDRFDERTQRPKTKRELMNKYGYDIRHETDSNELNGTNGSVSQPRRVRNTSQGRYGGNRGGGGRGRREDRRPIHRGVRRSSSRGGHRGERYQSLSQQRDQPGTRVFKNTPPFTQRGNVNRRSNHRSHHRNEEQIRDKQQNNGGNRESGFSAGNSDDMATRERDATGHTGGKRYSTQRLATNYVPPPTGQQPLAPPPPPGTGPIPMLPPPDWHQPAYQTQPPATVPPPPATPAAAPPPPIAVSAPVHNFRSSDIVYFDPQPQQLYRTPIPPRAKKRLEIVPPQQTKSSS
ncbi:unnamed protein product [Thelazia callipaeda]|uniref:Protein CASC3 n=1 Tax=Thelazia callipaeda TaxID=103827 RepID=A0A0N5CVR9_THECL|nr:unnamed protein product [Thelazia callipaeda]